MEGRATPTGTERGGMTKGHTHHPYGNTPTQNVDTRKSTGRHIIGTATTTTTGGGTSGGTRGGGGVTTPTARSLPLGMPPWWPPVLTRTLVMGVVIGTEVRGHTRRSVTPATVTITTNMAPPTPTPPSTGRARSGGRDTGLTAVVAMTTAAIVQRNASTREARRTQRQHIQPVPWGRGRGGVADKRTASTLLQVCPPTVCWEPFVLICVLFESEVSFSRYLPL